MPEERKESVSACARACGAEDPRAEPVNLITAFMDSIGDAEAGAGAGACPGLCNQPAAAASPCGAGPEEVGGISGMVPGVLAELVSAAAAAVAGASTRTGRRLGPAAATAAAEGA